MADARTDYFEEFFDAPPRRARSAEPASRLGTALREARQHARLELDDVAEIINVRFAHLEALEAGRLNELPADPYGKNFVRLYAQAVGLEPSRALLLEQLDRLLPGAAEGADHFRAHHLPLSQWRWRQPDGRVLLAGDAAGLINPMTGEGIYYAVASGILAGRAAARTLTTPDAGGPQQAGARHRVSVRRLLARHLRHTFVTTMLDAGVDLRDVQIAARHADPRTTMRYDRARKNLDRHPNYILAAYMASST